MTKEEPATAHTGGTWKNGTFGRGGEDYKYIRQVDGDVIAETYPLFGRLNPEGERLANARLIAAAPELLAALKDLVEQAMSCTPQHEEDGIDISQAEAAIAKASPPLK